MASPDCRNALRDGFDFEKPPATVPAQSEPVDSIVSQSVEFYGSHYKADFPLIAEDYKVFRPRPCCRRNRPEKGP